MRVEIKPGGSFLIDVVTDQDHFFRTNSIEKKGNLLEAATKKLDRDISEVAEAVKNIQNGGFFWCYTYDIHRDDGIKGTVLAYYLLEIIKSLDSENGIEELSIYYPFKKWVLEKIKKEQKIAFIYKTRLETRLKEWIRHSLGPLKYIKAYIFSSFKKSKTLPEKLAKQSIFIFSGANSNLNRLKGFPNTFKSHHTIILDISLTHLVDFHSKEEFSTRAYTLKSCLYALKNTFLFFKTRKVLFKDIDLNKNLYANYINHQSFLQTFYVFLRWEGLNKIFKFYKPKQLIVSSAFGDPLKRMPLGAARVNGVETSLFACRPFLSFLRSEDRIIKADIMEYNNASIGDHFVVLDQFSLDHVLHFGLPENKVSVYPGPEENKEGKILLKDGLLILFAHEKYNEDVIETLEKFKENNNIITHIYYREHPAVRLNSRQKKRIKQISPASECITNYSWNDVKLENILAFTSNSTSAIDAANRGAQIVWCPYFSEHSTQFLPIMKKTGVVCNTEEEFFKVLKLFLNQN